MTVPRRFRLRCGARVEEAPDAAVKGYPTCHRHGYQDDYITLDPIEYTPGGSIPAGESLVLGLPHKAGFPVGGFYGSHMDIVEEILSTSK